MANAVLDGSGANGFTATDGENYGCAGRGSYDPFEKTLGHHVDATDTAFYVWKKCIQCAAGDQNDVKAYDYDKINDTCGEYLDALSVIHRKNSLVYFQSTLLDPVAHSVNVIAY